MVHQETDFLTRDECKFLIDIHKHVNDYPLKRVHRDTTLVDCSSYISMSRLDLANNTYFDFLRYIESKITAHIKSFDENAFINYFECVHWPAGSSQPAHKDFDYHPWTSIIYLNDTYGGGETFVGDVDLQQIVPVQGKIITFKGSRDTHGVCEVTSGERFTCPIWYKSV